MYVELLYLPCSAKVPSVASTSFLFESDCTKKVVTVDELLLIWTFFDVLLFSYVHQLLQSNNLTSFSIFLWSPLNTESSLCSKCMVFFRCVCVFLPPPNPAGPFCATISSIGPTVKDREADWKCCHCPGWVFKYHLFKTIQVIHSNCKEQSHYRCTTFTFLF